MQLILFCCNCFNNSSLSINGIRGTLAKKSINSDINGKFFGKTGTLSNVFALSGYIYKKNKPTIISIIQNSENIQINKAYDLLTKIFYFDKCI